VRDPYTELVSSYFGYLAERFPVMCASDEFHFLPRAEDACNYYDSLDSLTPVEIEETSDILKDFQWQFKLFVGPGNSIEKSIDIELLNANIAGILMALEKNGLWRHNPLLYLKIAFIGIDHALTKPSVEENEWIGRVTSRLSRIPQLFRQAIENITTVPEVDLLAARAMVEDGKQYLIKIRNNLTNKASIFSVYRTNIEKGLQGVLSALETFTRRLSSMTPVPDRHFKVNSLSDSLHNHFLSNRTLEEVFQIALNESSNTRGLLEKTKRKIDPGKSWQELYHAYYPSDIEGMDALELYRREMEDLRLFFSRHGFRESDIYATQSSSSPVKVADTPAYLRSVRGSASFGAALTANRRETSFFYITTSLAGSQSMNAEDLLKKRLHREYKFLSAHEVVPGHHLLDSVRRGLENPVRRQIESPLFYEGWASYAETLLEEYGYIDTPLESLVDLKRRLWRSVRCRIDVGLSTGMLSRNDAVALLTATGFAREESERQVDRFRLNPGYQLCYSLGSYEIRRLRSAYGSEMTGQQFHSFLLEGGELPFHLIEKRFEAFLETRSK